MPALEQPVTSPISPARGEAQQSRREWFGAAIEEAKRIDDYPPERRVTAAERDRREYEDYLEAGPSAYPTYRDWCEAV